jgi:hypothetical protein
VEGEVTRAAFIALLYLAAEVTLLCWLFGPSGPDHETAVALQFYIATANLSLFAVAAFRFAYLPPHASDRAEREAVASLGANAD